MGRGRFVGVTVTTSHGAAVSRFSAGLDLYTAIGPPSALLARLRGPENKLLPAPMLCPAYVCVCALTPQVKIRNDTVYRVLNLSVTREDSRVRNLLRFLRFLNLYDTTKSP